MQIHSTDRRLHSITETVLGRGRNLVAPRTACGPQKFTLTVFIKGDFREGIARKNPDF